MATMQFVYQIFRPNSVLNDLFFQKGFKALHVIARKDDANAAALLLKNGYSPNITAPNGYTPLHIAAKYGSVNTTILLIESSANVDALAKHEICPLHVAAKHGQTDIVSLLIEASASINPSTKDGLTPLHCAARDGHEHCVELLLVHNAPVTAKTKHGLTALHMTAQGNHVNCANYLLGHGCHIDSATLDGVTPLHVAAHYGNLSIAQLFLDRGADIDCRAKNGYTALHVACKKSRESVVQLLIRYGADVHIKNMNGQTALHLAAYFGMVNIVLILIQSGALIEVKTMREETILHIACRTKQMKIVRLLLRNGAKVDPMSKLDETPLLIACRQHCEEIVSLLLDNHANPDARNKDESTALHIAARDGNEKIVEYLLDHNASIDLKNMRQFTPLHEAAKGGHMLVTSMLIEKKANLNSQAQNGLTPLHMACHCRHYDLAVFLIENGADTQVVAKNGFTPLHIASRKNEFELAIFLLGNGVDADAITRNGTSPLHIAAEEGNVDIADALLENGASPGIQTKNGITPLHLAAKYNQIEVVKKLIKYAAPVNSQTIRGYTPLHMAAFFGHTDVARLLLQDSADVEAKTKNANTPLHIASLRGHPKMVDILLKHNAPTNTLNKDGYTSLHIAEVTHQKVIINTLVKVTHVIIQRDEEDQQSAAEKLRLSLTAPEELEETLLFESLEESEAEASFDRRQLHEDFQDSFLGFEESTSPESGIASIVADSTATQHIPIHVTEESPIISQESSVPALEFTPPDIVLTSEHNDIMENVLTIPPTITGSFLISFLVDARGGCFESIQSGIRVSIPRGACAMPTRIMVRLQRSGVKIILPMTSVNEGLVSRIIELEPQGIQFLKPVTIEVPHFGSLRKRERELIVLRNDPDSDYWREHVSTRIHSELNEEDGFTEMPTSPEHGSKSGTQFVRIVTQDLPERFVILARPRKEKFLMFPEGGVLKSSLLAKAQIEFMDNTLNMSTKIILQRVLTITLESLQVQLMDNSILHADDTGHYSSIIKLEPHMKLVNPITVVLPCPWITSDQTFAVSPNLRLMALMPDSTNDLSDNYHWNWNDVTEVCCLTAVESCCRFQTTFLTTYWLIEYNEPERVSAKADLLYPRICSLPFITKFVVFARGLTADTSELRVFCTTNDNVTHTLEKQQGLVEVARSRDVEVYDGQAIYLTFEGNMTPATMNLKIIFRPFRQNRLTFKVSALNALETWSCNIGFIGSLRPDSNDRDPLLCNLEVLIPESGLQEDATFTTAPVYQVSDDIFQMIARNIGDSWMQLAMNLEMNESEIQGVIDLSSDNGELAAITSLELWRSSRGADATFEKLGNALESIGRRDLCDLVESRSPTALSPRNKKFEFLQQTDQKPKEAIDLNELMTSENNNNNNNKFEFHDSDLNKQIALQQGDLSAIVDSPLLMESSVDDVSGRESPSMECDEEVSIEEMQRVHDNTFDFDELMQNVIGQHPHEDEAAMNVEERVEAAQQQDVEEQPPHDLEEEQTPMQEAAIKKPQIEISDEIIMSEERKQDETPEIDVQCLSEIEDQDFKSEILDQCPPVVNGNCIRLTGGTPVLIESTDENSNVSDKDRLNTQVSAQLSNDTQTMVINEVAPDTTKSHATDQESDDIIRQMFGADQSVMAFFDAPQKEDGDQNGVTFI
eukprot:gene12077-13320_t